MKLIVAVIRPEVLAAVEAALNRLGATLMSVTKVIGCGQEVGYKAIYRGQELHLGRPKLRLEIAVDDRGVEAAVKAVARAGAPTDGEPCGECEVFVLDLVGCIGIRDGDRELMFNGA
jgi:nitrogen regulatory protein PII